MKLIHIKKSDYDNHRIYLKIPTVTVNGKNGVISINRSAMEHFKLKTDDHVRFLKDTDEKPPEWYFHPVWQDDDESFRVYESGNVLKFSNKALAQQIIKDLQKKLNPHMDDSVIPVEVSARFRIATKEAMDGDKTIPDCYAMMGGKVFG
jgi:hypothetical protein